MHHYNSVAGCAEQAVLYKGNAFQTGLCCHFQILVPHLSLNLNADLPTPPNFS